MVPQPAKKKAQASIAVLKAWDVIAIPGTGSCIYLASLKIPRQQVRDANEQWPPHPPSLHRRLLRRDSGRGGGNMGTS
jgi:hypothetical protein